MAEEFRFTQMLIRVIPLPNSLEKPRLLIYKTIYFKGTFLE